MAAQHPFADGFDAKKSWIMVRKRSFRTSRAMSCPVSELIADDAMELTKALTSSFDTSARAPCGASANRTATRKALKT
jgi:hypothetical protein